MRAISETEVDDGREEERNGTELGNGWRLENREVGVLPSLLMFDLATAYKFATYAIR